MLSICISSNAQTNTNIEKKMPTFFSQIDAPFAVDELIKIHQENRSYLQNLFIKDRSAMSPSYVYLYINDKCAEVLYDSLTSRKDPNIKAIVDEMKQILPHSTPVRPNVNWGDVFKMCDTCPFLQDPYDDRVFPSKFALLYLEYADILDMIKYENGEPWKNMLGSMASEDYFTAKVCMNEIRHRISSNEIRFLIDKWSKYEDKEIRDMISILEGLLRVTPLEINLLNETWKVYISGKKYLLNIKDMRNNDVRAELLNLADGEKITLKGSSEDLGCYISLMMSPEDSEDEIELKISKSALKITGSWKEVSSGKRKIIQTVSK